jgi:hypothetical protein
MQFRKEESEAKGNHLDVMESRTEKYNIFFGIFFLMVNRFLNTTYSSSIALPWMHT